MKEQILAFLSRDFSGLVISLLTTLVSVSLLNLVSGPVGRIFFSIIALFAMMLVISSMLHIIRLARMDAALPPPGKTVDIGGVRIHMICGGKATGPSLIWLGGGHVGGLAFIAQHEAMLDSAHSVLIDRPGTGWSDVGAFPRTTAREAQEIMQAISIAGIPGPYIWIGHSFGGLLAANIARRYPKQTAALVLLDPTPPDVIVYGADRKGLGALGKTEWRTAWRHVFGLYGRTKSSALPFSEGAASQTYPDPFLVLDKRRMRAGQHFAAASIYEELSPEGMAKRAWNTVVHDGDLGDIPLYLVAPKMDDSLRPYAESVVGKGQEAERFLRFLMDARERYMRASSQARRIVAPKGTGHNFVYEAPEFLTHTIQNIHAECSGLSHDG